MLFQYCIATAAVYGINTAYEQRDLLPLPLLFFLHHQANSCNGKKTDKQMDKHITAIPCLGKIDNFYHLKYMLNMRSMMSQYLGNDMPYLI